MTKSFAALAKIGADAVDRKKKIGLALLVVAVGVGVALQFRRTDSAVGHSETTSPPFGAATQPFGATPPTFGATPPPPGATPAAKDGVAARSTLFAPMPMPVTSSDIVQAPMPGASFETGEDHALVDLNEPDKVHKITDGDTLPKLAKRYWGRADRYVDLYAY